MRTPLPIEFLIIAPPPAPALEAFAQGLQALRVGMVQTIAPLAAGDERARQSLGALAVRETLGRAEIAITLTQHAQPVLHGMDPTEVARLATGLDAPAQHALRAGVIALDMRFSLLENDLEWGLRWVLAAVERLAELARGVVFDPAAQRCHTPAAIATLRLQPLITQVAVHARPWGAQTLWLHTHGLQKLGQPELELVGVPEGVQEIGLGLLRMVAESLSVSDPADGPALRAGMTVECEDGTMLVARQSPAEADHRALFGRVRLVSAPMPGARLPQDAAAAVIAAATRAAQSAVHARQWPQAQDLVTRVLAVAPGDPSALLAQVRLLLGQGQPRAALDAAEYLRHAAPGEWRGAFAAGLALLALGGLAEARHHLTQAIELAPDEPEPFEMRAQLYARLGQQDRAAADRARARMLAGQRG